MIGLHLINDPLPRLGLELTPPVDGGGICSGGGGGGGGGGGIALSGSPTVPLHRKRSNPTQNSPRSKQNRTTISAKANP